ncbi:hypothetical protein Nepgr_017277 [Nepenthes gracilis]|uniref:Pentatricopeptide repeat-containing protein n=1 Tax=Nepenthes gracilis TaxID=150966 RepID=A0AAD3XT56_NEPGR|nr:hypothetical protein Nepgr_017277 [Nepenthes gracilis]
MVKGVGQILILMYCSLRLLLPLFLSFFTACRLVEGFANDCGMVEMEAGGHATYVVTFTILINAICKVGDANEAFAHLDVMENQDVMPNSCAYNFIHLWPSESRQVG